MKKLIFAFGFLLFVPYFQSADAAVINYWDYWENRNATTQAQTQTTSVWGRSNPVTSRRTTASTPRTTTAASARTSQSRWMNYLRTKYANRLTNRSTTSQPSYSRPTVNTTSFARNGVWATVNPIELRQDINDITDAPVSLFRIGLSHNGSGSDYTEAVQVDEMRFQITDNTGVVSDFSDFELVTEDQTFDFDSRGYVTLRFNNFRLARSESKGLDIAIQIEEPDLFPRYPGSFRVKLTDVTAYQEFSQANVDVSISGRSVSDYVVLNPRGSVSAGGTSSVNTYSTSVAGRPLGGGEKEYLLALKLNASFDDFLVEKLTVTNQHGSNADQLVSQVNLVNLGTGKIIGTTRFIGGKATFTLNNRDQVYIPRNSRASLGIQVVIVSDPNVDSIDNRLTLIVDKSDIELFGVGAGREVPDSQKTVSVDSETFTVAKSTLAARGGFSFSAVQPEIFTDGNLHQVARFKITNAGSQEVSFARLTISVTPRGLDLTTGSTADMKLVQLVGARERERFSTTSVVGNIGTFDALNEIYVDGGETKEFAIMAKLDDSNGLDDEDGAIVRILGDSSFTKGTLSDVRASGAQFIWSDHSGRPHIPGSSDWFNGYQFPGIPSQSFANRID